MTTMGVVAIVLSTIAVLVSLAVALLMVYRLKLHADAPHRRSEMASVAMVAPDETGNTLEQFTRVAESISEGDSFTNGERDLAMRLAREISQSPAVSSDPGFLISLESLVESFVGADLTLHIDALDEMFSSAATESAEINRALLLHLGLRLLSEAPAKKGTIDRFKRHMDAAARHNNMQHAFPFWIVYQFVCGNDDEVGRLMGKLGSLDVVSKVGAMQDIQRWGDPAMAQESQPAKLREANKHIGDFTAKYRAQLEELI